MFKMRSFLCSAMIASAMPMASHAAEKATAGWTPGECGSDGFCSIIRVEQQVSQRTPTGPQGIVVGTIDDDGFKPSTVGRQVAQHVCRKEVRVPRVVYEAVTQMFNSVVRRGDQGALPASLTPAEQTMLLYYNTIMQQTMNFQCNNQ